MWPYHVELIHGCVNLLHCFLFPGRGAGVGLNLSGFDRISVFQNLLNCPAFGIDGFFQITLQLGVFLAKLNEKVFDFLDEGFCTTDHIIPVGYACARNLRKLMDECKEYMEIRDRLMMEHGKSEGDGKFTFDPENGKAFAEAIREYAVIEHDVDVFQVSEEVFCSGNLTTREMYALAWMVKEDA